MFNKNSKLRAAGEEVPYTKELIDEYIKCKEDIIYFAEKYFYIVSIDKGKHRIQMYEFQKKIIKAFQSDNDGRPNLILMLPRQMGKTTISTVYLLHYMLFNNDKTVAVLANKEKTAIEIMRRIQLAYSMLPLWLQKGIVDGGWNKTSIKLGNGMRMIAATTSSDSISGETISLLYMDEFAKVKPHIAEEFITATMPVVTSGKSSKVIMVSTPLGLNFFYEYWVGAVNGDNDFFPIKVGWWEHPDRDDEWKRRTLRLLNGNLSKFSQEYSCVSELSALAIKHKITGKTDKISIEELYDLL